MKKTSLTENLEIQSNACKKIKQNSNLINKGILKNEFTYTRSISHIYTNNFLSKSNSDGVLVALQNLKIKNSSSNKVYKSLTSSNFLGTRTNILEDKLKPANLKTLNLKTNKDSLLNQNLVKYDIMNGKFDNLLQDYVKKINKYKFNPTFKLSKCVRELNNKDSSLYNKKFRFKCEKLIKNKIAKLSTKYL